MIVILSFLKTGSICTGRLGLLKVIIFKYVGRYLQSVLLLQPNHRRMLEVKQTILLLAFFVLKVPHPLSHVTGKPSDSIEIKILAL